MKKQSLNQTWQAQIRQLAAHNPKLARVLWQNRQVYFDWFVRYYQQLATPQLQLVHFARSLFAVTSDKGNRRPFCTKGKRILHLPR